jgi:hypothetical protein
MRPPTRSIPFVVHLIATAVMAYSALVTSMSIRTDQLVPHIFLWFSLSFVQIVASPIVWKNPLNVEALALIAVALIGGLNAIVTRYSGLSTAAAALTYDFMLIGLFVAPIATIVGFVRFSRPARKQPA